MNHSDFLLRVKVFSHLAGELWDIWDKYKTIGKKDIPNVMIDNLAKKIISEEKNSLLKETFYMIYVGNKVYCQQDVSIEFGPETAFSLIHSTNLWYKHIKKIIEQSGIEQSGIVTGGIYLDFKITNVPQNVPQIEDIVRAITISPSDPTYLYLADFNWKLPKTFADLFSCHLN
ncbi:MAG: hypothetical protein WC587_03820 [Candidatus Paceibacterota bacterium]